jgi:hypothetical protein
MNKEDILRMAFKAGFTKFDLLEGVSEMLGEFAALVAAHEREACAAIILERGVDLSGLARDPMTQAFTEKLLMVCAAAIRARSE